MAGSVTLWQIGLLQFQVAPMNVEGVEYETGADFAAKDIVGAAKPREFTGEADTELSFSGKLFPHRLGGLDELDLAESMSKSGDPQMVVRGDGRVFGWYFIEKLKQKHETLNTLGIGREISYDIKMIKSPNAASAQSMLATIFGLFG